MHAIPLKITIELMMVMLMMLMMDASVNGKSLMINRANDGNRANYGNSNNDTLNLFGLLCGCCPADNNKNEVDKAMRIIL